MQGGSSVAASSEQPALTFKPSYCTTSFLSTASFLLRSDKYGDTWNMNAYLHTCRVVGLVTSRLLCVDVQSCSGPQECHAFVLWFDTHFSTRFCKEHAVKLSTSPYTPQTHWCQTVLVLRYILIQAAAQLPLCNMQLQKLLITIHDCMFVCSVWFISWAR